MRASLSDKAPAILLGLATVILAVAFSVPVGRERLAAATPYAPLEGYAGSFKASEAAAPASGAAQKASAVLGLVSQLMGNRGASKPSNGSERGKPKPRPAVSPVAVVSVSTAAQQAVVTPRPQDPPVESFDSISEAFETNPAKCPLNEAVSNVSVTFQLRGVARSSGRFIVKVAIINRGSQDFFVKDLVARDSQGEIDDSKSYVRLFVEPSRTREGFVVFSKLRVGACIQVALKEDRENGRVLQLPVRYPF